MELLTPLLYGIGTGLPLVVGAIVGAYWRPRQTLVATVLAFASGSLITGLAFELFQPALQATSLTYTAAGFFLGTGIFVGVKYIVELRDATIGAALLATVVLDGLAENITLGVALIGPPGEGPLAVLAGVAANNLPEALGGATSMTEGGRSIPWTVGLWTVTATVLALVVVVGYVVFAAVAPSVLALIRAAGGGAILASLADEIMPDAYEDGGPAVAFATALGFVLTFKLT